MVSPFVTGKRDVLLSQSMAMLDMCGISMCDRKFFVDE